MADTLRTLTAVAPGPKHTHAIVALELNGTCEYADYVRHRTYRSNTSAASKVVQMLDTLAKYGDSAYRGDDTSLKAVGDGLLELKPRDHRLLLFLAGVTWIIVGARQKPKGQAKVQDAWIQEGKRRKTLYLDLLGQNKIQTL